MKNLKQINENFLDATKEFSEYWKYRRIQEQILKNPLNRVNLASLKEAKQFIETHQLVMNSAEIGAKKEWEKICQARTFHYEELGNLIVSLLNKKSQNYYYATRLVKYPFEEKSFYFYQIVSFITTNIEDLKPFLLDRISKTMFPYYVNDSMVPKPISKELESELQFDRMIKKELDMRNAANIYVITENDISSIFEKSPYQAQLTKMPFLEIQLEIESIIAKRYHQQEQFLLKKRYR